MSLYDDALRSRQERKASSQQHHDSLTGLAQLSRLVDKYAVEYAEAATKFKRPTSRIGGSKRGVGGTRDMWPVNIGDALGTDTHGYAPRLLVGVKKGGTWTWLKPATGFHAVGYEFGDTPSEFSSRLDWGALEERLRAAFLSYLQ